MSILVCASHVMEPSLPQEWRSIYASKDGGNLATRAIACKMKVTSFNPDVEQKSFSFFSEAHLEATFTQGVPTGILDRSIVCGFMVKL